MKATIKERLKLFVIGLLMGAAELVPGISGGTIAFVTGIYLRFVNALRRFEPSLLFRLKNKGFKAVWSLVDGNFLLSLFAGMGVSIILFAGLVSYLLAEHGILMWSFFFGLVLSSVWLVAKQVSEFSMQLGFIAGIGCALGFIIVQLIPASLEPTSVNIFIGGAIAVCAWILPGLSGSFILLLLGLYQHVLEAVKTLDIMFLLTLAAGCSIGLVSFAQVLTRLLTRFKDETLALLMGLMAGSLVKLWPWQNIISYQIKADGSQVPLEQIPVSPFNYIIFTGNDPEITMAVAGLILGFIGVLGLNALSKFEFNSTSKLN